MHDGLDLAKIPWRRGHGYDVEALSRLYTSNDAWAPDAPRPAASYIWGAGAGALAAFCSEPLSFERSANGRPVAIAWSSARAAAGWSLPILTNGCTARAGTSMPTFIP